MRNLEEKMHRLARIYMNSIIDESNVSLDEFMIKYDGVMTTQQKNVGNAILELF